MSIYIAISPFLNKSKTAQPFAALTENVSLSMKFSGNSTLFIFATRLIAFSASLYCPCTTYQRVDSGMNLK